MLEALIAFAVATLVVGALSGLYALSTNQQSTRINRMLMTEVGAAVLEEYVITYPAMPSSGEVGGKWQWTIEETRVTPDRISALEGQISYIELTADVWLMANTAETIKLTARFAVRGAP